MTACAVLQAVVKANIQSNVNHNRSILMWIDFDNFGENVTEKVGSKKVGYFIFPPHLTSASALPGEMLKHKNNILSLKCIATLQPVAGLI